MSEISQFEKVDVEFVSGAIPTVHLFDADGNDLDSFVLGDLRLEEVLDLFEKHGFKLVHKNQIEKTTLPASITELANVYYELYAKNINYDAAKEFAASREERGGSRARLLTYNCSFQEAHIRKWLSGFKVSAIWLGGERNQDKIFHWAQGPLSQITFQDNASQYSNWVKGEPNNAGDSENCVVQNLKDLSGWNDVNCISQTAYLVVEYGNIVVPCPSLASVDLNDPKFDPNFKVIPAEEVDL